MIKDWNRNEVKKGEVFHFAHSLRPFTLIASCNDSDMDKFLALDTMTYYSFDLLWFDELNFYRKDDDEDFLGVDVDGKVEWVS